MCFNRANINIKVLLKYLIAFCIYFFGFVNKSICQERMNATFGIGFPELTNIGMLYQHNQIQFGVNIGGWYYSDNLIGNYRATSISGDFYYHFAGFSELSKRCPWFFRTGLTYLNASSADKHLFLNCRTGRDLNVSEKFGLSISIGLTTRLFYFNKSEDGPDDVNNIFLLPGAGLSLFYRFGTNTKNQTVLRCRAISPRDSK